MKINIFLSVLFLGMAVALTGCVKTVGGQMKAGVPFTRDTIESRYERPLAQLASAATNVLNRNGQVTSHDIINNVIEARVDERTIWVKLNELEDNIVQVLVQARTKSGGADISWASEIDKQIALELAAKR
jgi:hypothetical protein